MLGRVVALPGREPFVFSESPPAAASSNPLLTPRLLLNSIFASHPPSLDIAPSFFGKLGLSSSTPWWYFSHQMAATGPTPPMSEKHDFKLPMPPPPLHTRSTNDHYDTPSTPNQAPFISPQQTPQGSPSKNQLPPGAYDLPNVFDNAMKLVPTVHNSPPKIGRQQLAPSSPNKSGISVTEDRDNDFPSYQNASGLMPGSPTRKSNKENTPPGHRPQLHKESSFITQAAQSRQEPYRQREIAEPATRSQYTVQRGPSPEDLEKLQKPSVKRLANVTQLCKQIVHRSRLDMQLTASRLP